MGQSNGGMRCNVQIHADRASTNQQPPRGELVNVVVGSMVSNDAAEHGNIPVGVFQFLYFVVFNYVLS